MPRILSPAEFRAQPWKNGGGVTHEIVRWPAPGASPASASDAFDVRISLADDRVAGPFSRFPGYRRWSFLAGDAPIVLEVGGIAHELVALADHIEVAGDVAIACARPPGPTGLLNILIRDGVDAQVGHGPCPRPVRFAFALAAHRDLASGHAMVLDPPEHMVLHREAVWLCAESLPE